MSTTDAPTPPEAGTTTPPTPPEGAAPESGTTPPTPKGFDDVIGQLPEEDRQVVLERISKPNSEARQLRERLKELQPKAEEFDRLAEERKTDLEKAQEAAAQAQAREAALLKQVVQSSIVAAAAQTFADPSDAAAFLGDHTKFLADDGAVNNEAIASELKDLLERKPHLAKVTTPGLPGPHEAQGASGGGAAASLDAQIAEAEQKRDFTRSIALKQQRAAMTKKP